jgi:hypothetical protein
MPFGRREITREFRPWRAGDTVGPFAAAAINEMRIRYAGQKFSFSPI